ncbi:protein of unknown function UCP032285 [Flavobacterium limnosediminis JC2902]|uniref:MepB family protein n=1 Tax=Flavobacterium limnosediminis JC2902 TaxID=1341181 RepID=V6SRU0_9FLAO|nr:MepB family protein [Flavobacterium limnosediminis]ESU28912.1 protein of unknown function UCP032285 [Flavobacterium limnosediminis JC2902]
MTEEIVCNVLGEVKQQVYDKCGFVLLNPIEEKESTDYAACRFQLNNLNIVFRSAKTTPTKIGQFVTIWKRIENGPIQPFDFSDNVDLFVINTKSENHFGQFVFPKSVLLEQGVLTSELKEGKRAIRVYPPWDVTISKQAQKTQNWQRNYFLEIPFDGLTDLDRVSKLYFQKP